MPSESPTLEPSEWPLPPLPTRNPLRDDPLYKGKSRLLQAEPEGNYMAPASPISQDIFNELDRELKDTQQRLVSAIYEGDKVQSRNKSPGEHTPEVWGRRVSKSSDDDACTVMESLMAEAELEESSSDDEITNFRLSLETSDVHKTLNEEDQGCKTVDKINDFARTESLQRSQIDRAARPNPTTPDSSSEPALPRTTTTTGEDQNAPHPGAWLARELPQELQAAGQSLRLSRDLSFTSSQKRYALSPFPPTSPMSGNREYVSPNSPVSHPTCPLSLLNNGRDAYGNHIPSNTRDLSAPRFDLGSPALIPLPDNQSTLGQDGPPQVHLRGGWELPRSLWRRSGHAEPNQAQDPPDGQGRLRALEYEDTATPNTRSPVGARTPQRVAVTNRRNNGASVRADQGNNTHSPHQRKPSDLANENSYENLSLVFNKHFGIQRVPPVSAIDNPRTKVYKHLDIPTWTGPSSPPIDAASSLTNTTSALQPPEFPIYRPTPPHVTGGRPESLASLGTITASQSVKSAPRQEKRWDKELHRPPPKDPAPIYPEEIDFYLAEELGSQDNESIFSARTADDRLQGLVELQTSGPYRKAKQLREARRILEEQERRRRQEERERDIDAHTITPSMSISTRHMRRQPLPRGDTYKPGMGIVPEDESYNSSRRNLDLPRQNNTDEQFMHQQFPQRPGAAAADPAPPVTGTAPAPLMEPAGVRNDTTRPNLNSMEMAFHIAGKVTRFLLAAPSDPRVKTYSKRYPPNSSDQQRQVSGPPLRTNSSALERISDVAPTQTQRARGPGNDIMQDTTTTTQNKGKGKARDLVAPPTSPRAAAAVDAPRYTLDSTFSGSTAVPSNARYTGNTLPAGGAGGAGGPSTLRTVPNGPQRRGGLQIPQQQRSYEEESDAGTTWPEQDSQGNVWAGAGAHIRGGDGGSNSEYAVGMDVRSSFSAASSVVGDEKGKKLEKLIKKKSSRKVKETKGKEGRGEERKEKKKSAWGNKEYALAMHSMGNAGYACGM